MALEQFKTQVLLLHSQQSKLDALSTGFDDQYAVHCATSGVEALTTLGETPIDVIVSAHDLPGMSGYEALKEARKRSPETIGILLAGEDASDGLEAMVGDQEFFQVVRGEVTAAALVQLIEETRQRVRLLALAESANDTAADVDEPPSEHIIMETADNGSVIISDGTGRMPALKPEKIQVSPNQRGSEVDVLVLTRDEEFLATIKESARGLHNVFHATTPDQAEEFAGRHKAGVLVTDAAMIGSDIESLNQRLRNRAPRLVAIVAGRRDDGELLMDLINRGQVYRFLLKPVSPGRARLAIEASIKHHLDAPESAFKGRPGPAVRPPAATPAASGAARTSRAAGSTPQEAAATPPTEVESAADSGPRKGLFATARLAFARRQQAKPAPAQSSAPKAASEAVPTARQEPHIGGKAETPKTAEAPKAAPPRPAPPRPAPPKSAPTKAAPAAPAPSRAAAPKAATAKPAPAKAAQPKPPPPPKTAAPKPADAPKKPAAPAAPARPPAPKAAPAGTNLISDGLDDAFDDGGFTETVAGLATTVRRTFSGRPEKRPPPTPSAPADGGGIAGLVRNPRLMAGAGVVIAVTAIGLWLSGGDDETASPATNVEPTAAETATSEPAPVETPAPAPEPSITAPLFADLLDRARDARDDGRLFAPAGDNAVEYYLAARSAGPGNDEVETEISALIEEVFGHAETAMLEDRYTDASRALRVIGLADPDNPRLTFLNAQLRQQQLQSLLDQARAAIRSGRFEDAGTLLTQAEAVAGDDNSEIEALTDELASARSADRLDDVLAMANRAFAEDRLTAPGNDNARYFYELALTISPGNAAARQGLNAVAGKLVLRARSAVDEGNLGLAERLLADARAVDPESEDLADTAAALEAAMARRAAPEIPTADTPAAGSREAEVPAADTESGTPAPPPATTAAADASATRTEPAGAGTGANVEPAEPAAPEAGSAETEAPPMQAATMPAPEDAALSASAGEAESAATSGAAPAADGPSEAPAEPSVVSISALKRVRYVPPQYPRSAARRNITGWVDLNFTVSREGEVTDIVVTAAEPTDVFDDAAVDAVEQWQFEPVIENGEARDKRVAVRMTFALQ